MSQLTCQDFPTLGCCDSCHEDVDYGFELIDRQMPNGDTAIICCRIAVALDKQDEQRFRRAAVAPSEGEGK